MPFLLPRVRLPFQLTTLAPVIAAIATLVTVLPAHTQTATLEPQEYRRQDDRNPYAGSFSDLERDVDQFWADAFLEARVAYEAPTVVTLDRAMNTGCGRHGPERVAFYCPIEQSIYLSPQFVAEQELQIGDFAPIVVLAHEWGHHVQHLLRLADPGGNAYELQADCLAGAFTRGAEEQGLLEPGDFLEALAMSESAGDPAWFPQDQPGAHGTYADRRNAVMRGYLDGAVGCGLEWFPPITPTPTATQAVATRTPPTPTPAPTPHLGCASSLLDCLPPNLPLVHASCFGIVDDGEEDFEQVIERFSGVPDASKRLQSWGWRASAFRQFGCDGPPEGEAGWIDISAHQFADSLSAQEAVDYFTSVRLDGSPHIQGASPGIGDHSTAMSGPAVNGKDFTIYASQGPLLIRVTGVSPSGIPFMNVLTVAQAVLADVQSTPPTPTTTPDQEAWRSAASYLPTIPAVHYRDCFEVLDEGAYTYNGVIDMRRPTGLTQSQIDELGWRDGAYIVFTCDEPLSGRAAQIDVGIHQFQDGDSARQALPHFSTMFELGDNHDRDCDVASNLVICVSARSLTGSPLSDVAFVLQQVVAAAR